MIPLPPDVRVWVATGVTDMRRGMNGLSLQVQQGLGRDPHSGDLFIFRGRRGDLIKIPWHDGLGFSLYAKRLERGRLISYGLCQALSGAEVHPPTRGNLAFRETYTDRRSQDAGFVSTVAQALIRGLVTP